LNSEKFIATTIKDLKVGGVVLFFKWASSDLRHISGVFPSKKSQTCEKLVAGLIKFPSDFLLFVVKLLSIQKHREQ
jgi:hypothetical protein